MPRRTFLAMIDAPQKEENNGLIAQPFNWLRVL
jgi:hypothetical protein